MSAEELADWEENFCLAYYRGRLQDLSTTYLDSQKFYAGCCEQGESQDLQGIYATTCGTPWAGLNLAFVAEPIRRKQALHERLEPARAFYKERALPWILVVPEGWIAPGQHGAVEELLRVEGFQLAMEAQAITAPSLHPPGPALFQVRAASSSKDWLTIAAINAESWQVPVEWVEPLLGSSAFQSAAKGWIGYADGNAVSAVVTFPALPYTFCAWGATVPAYRRRGFGDYITRHGAAQCDAPERPLFAISSPKGLSTWMTAGFEQRQPFRLYLAPG